jgi:hypothetical protein
MLSLQPQADSFSASPSASRIHRYFACGEGSHSVKRLRPPDPLIGQPPTVSTVVSSCGQAQGKKASDGGGGGDGDEAAHNDSWTAVFEGKKNGDGRQRRDAKERGGGGGEEGQGGGSGGGSGPGGSSAKGGGGGRADGEPTTAAQAAQDANSAAASNLCLPRPVNQVHLSSPAGICLGSNPYYPYRKEMFISDLGNNSIHLVVEKEAGEGFESGESYRIFPPTEEMLKADASKMVRSSNVPPAAAAAAAASPAAGSGAVGSGGLALSCAGTTVNEQQGAGIGGGGGGGGSEGFVHSAINAAADGGGGSDADCITRPDSPDKVTVDCTSSRGPSLGSLGAKLADKRSWRTGEVPHWLSDELHNDRYLQRYGSALRAEDQILRTTLFSPCGIVKAKPLRDRIPPGEYVVIWSPIKVNSAASSPA